MHFAVKLFAREFKTIKKEGQQFRALYALSKPYFKIHLYTERKAGQTKRLQNTVLGKKILHEFRVALKFDLFCSFKHLKVPPYFRSVQVCVRPYIVAAAAACAQNQQRAHKDKPQL